MLEHAERRGVTRTDAENTSRVRRRHFRCRTSDRHSRCCHSRSCHSRPCNATRRSAAGRSAVPQCRGIPTRSATEGEAVKPTRNPVTEGALAWRAASRSPVEIAIGAIYCGGRAATGRHRRHFSTWSCSRGHAPRLEVRP
ncbi:hypothetical protein A33M_4322 [Rhodovulum sp. PH10]|nr:hypothetical protein A33M_4322 [Rhodovulum sp. PH10]